MMRFLDGCYLAGASAQRAVNPERVQSFKTRLATIFVSRFCKFKVQPRWRCGESTLAPSRLPP
jgi:hypothetical protein